MLITSKELSEFKRHTWGLSEAFGLDNRIENYKGTRPIGFYQWDLDCLLAVLEGALEDPHDYSDKETSGYKALLNF